MIAEQARIREEKRQKHQQKLEEEAERKRI
jgi:hypothetical protein